MVQFTNFWSRLFAAAVGIAFSLYCFTRENEWFPLIYWTGIGTLAVAELMRIMGANIILGIVNILILCEELLYMYTFGICDEIFISIPALCVATMILESENYGVGLSPVFTICWIAVPCYLCFIYTRKDPYFMIGFLCVVWFMDAGAYFSGHLFGRTPLLQSVSPKKTWEGFLGGAIVTVIVARICSIYVPSYGDMTWKVMALISIIFGQLGDLLESLIKRIYGVKDSGGFLLGHGGILDRYDSVFLSIVVAHLYLTFA